MVLPLAHAGHWAVYILYGAPVLIVLGSILVTMARDRRGGPDGSDGPGAAQPEAAAETASSAEPSRSASPGSSSLPK